MYQLISGKTCDFISIEDESTMQEFLTGVSPEVIAHSLSQINRWNGHTIVPVNVAWHSVAVAVNALDIVRRNWPQKYDELKLTMTFNALTHDAAEAYLGDIVAPIKGKMFVADEKEKRLIGAEIIEWNLLNLIRDKIWGDTPQLQSNGYVGNFPIDSIIHRADLAVRQIEKELWTKPLTASEEKDELWFMRDGIDYDIWKDVKEKMSTRQEYWMPNLHLMCAQESRKKWLEIWEGLKKGEVVL